ncbi:MAG: TetR/AcrR family transcriptional regulator [Ilumatobacteraceae bacterium]
MTADVNPRRRYNSTTRQEQARRTRSAIIEAAHHLFLTDGFARTTMPAVAAAAGVAVQTVYKAFASKPRLAKAVFDTAIAGDDDTAPMLEREALKKVRDEPDPFVMFRLYGEFLATVAPRHVPVQLVIRDAAATDPDARAVWAELQAERLTGMTIFATTLDDRGHLRAGLTIDQARDTLWTYNSAEIYQLLVVERGWTPQNYGRWVADALVAALLQPPRPART